MAHMTRRHERMGKRVGARGAEMKPNSSAMIKEDQGKNAGVPTEVVMKDWPSNSAYFLSGRMDDTIVGVDRQLSESARMLKKQPSGRKC